MSVLYKVLQKQKKPSPVSQAHQREEDPYETVYIHSIARTKKPKKSYKLRALLLALIIAGSYVGFEHLFSLNASQEQRFEIDLKPKSVPQKDTQHEDAPIDLFQPIEPASNAKPQPVPQNEIASPTPKAPSSTEPKNVPVETRSNADTTITAQTADQALKSGNLKGAFFAYIELLKKNPNDEQVINTLLNIAFSSNSAHKAWLGILENHLPENTFMRAEISDRFAHVEDYTNALLWIEKALAIDPQNITFHQNKAIYHDHLSQWQKAAEHYQQVLTLLDDGNVKAQEIDRSQIESRLNYLLSKTH